MDKISRIDKILLVSVLSWTGISLDLATRAWAQVAAPKSTGVNITSDAWLAKNPPKKKRIIFHLPDRSIPGSRIPGGTRSICLANTPQLPLTAIAPLTSDGSTNAEVPTVSDRPVFWVYLPQESIATAEFNLIENGPSQTVIYQQSIQLVKSGGIARISLPEDSTIRLKVNHSYLWTFSLLCDPEDPSNIFSVGGGVQRVAAPPLFQQKLKKTRPEDLPQLYALYGYWQEAVDALLQFRQRRPQDVNLLQDWTDLLTATKLERLVHEPILTHWSSSDNP